MNPKIKKLRDEVEATRNKLVGLESRLADEIKYCSHCWSEPDYSPIVEKAYTISADAEGTMGVDRRLEMYVPEKTIPRWKRECTNCGEVEYTSVTTIRSTQEPVFK